MNRRHWMACCMAGLGFVPTALQAASLRLKLYPRALLVDEQGDPLRASRLKPDVNYVFNYPFEATPVFLLHLGRPLVQPLGLSTRQRDVYEWPGGVGAGRSIVAYSAICPNDLASPTAERSPISFRKVRARRGVQDGLIHCCGDESQYDPARGAQVLAGPALQPLCTVMLAYEAELDILIAYGTLGADMFDDFFRRHDGRPGASAAVTFRTFAGSEVVVRELGSALQC